MPRYYTVFILCLTVFFLFADQNLMAPNLSAIADEFGFNDHERDEKLGGYIAFGFFVVGGPVALLVGYFTDSVNRCILFAVVVTCGELACLATYWIKTYEQLLACRILTGISIGGSTPIIFSILGDLFPENYRVYVSTLVGIAMSSGIAGGQLLAGVVGPAYNWRLPFLLVSIPAIVCANLVMLTVKEPARGSQEMEVRLWRQRKVEQRKRTPPSAKNTTENDEAGDRNVGSIESQQVSISNPMSYQGEDESSVVNENTDKDNDQEAVKIGEETEEDEEEEFADYSEKIEWRKLKVLFSTPSVWIIFLQGLPGCLPWGMVYVFLNDYFSADKGLSVSAATFALTCFGVGGLVGQLWGGWYGQRLYNRDPCYQCILMGGSTLASVGPMLYLINTKVVGDAIFYCMAVVAGGTISINGPNNVCIPEVRGSAFAVFMLTDDIGKGLGPALVVLFIQAFGGNRQTAFTVVVMFWLFCGVMLLSLVFFVHADEQAVSRNVKASLLLRSGVAQSAIFGLTTDYANQEAEEEEEEEYAQFCSPKADEREVERRMDSFSADHHEKRGTLSRNPLQLRRPNSNVKVNQDRPAIDVAVWRRSGGGAESEPHQLLLSNGNNNSGSDAEYGEAGQHL